MRYREVQVNRKLFSIGSSHTNLSAMFQCLGLEKIRESADNVILFFDQDCEYSITDLIRNNKMYPASVLVNDFNVNKVLEQVINKKDHTTMLGRLTNENHDNSMIIPGNIVIPPIVPELNAPLNSYKLCYDYVTQLYPKHYDISLKTAGHNFFVTALNDDAMDIVKEKVSFWMMQDTVRENLVHYIINKIPLEKE